MFDRLGGLQIDDQLELSRLFDGKITGLGAAQHFGEQPGNASSSKSCRLPSSSNAMRLTPVVLPPGRESDSTSPSSTMLSDKARIGIVFVAACAARVATGPALIIASGADLTIAAAASESCSLRRPNPPPATARFWPSMKPVMRSSSKNATYCAASRGPAVKKPMR